MKRLEAIEIVSEKLRDYLIFHTNGHICRESAMVRDRKENFYMIGSMGLAPSLALGTALVRPDKKVAVYDGDGSVLMNMGNLAMVGVLKPKNFLHIVFDNEAYGSTGDQRTISRDVPLEKIAQSCGYSLIEKVSLNEDLRAPLERCLAYREGPVFLLIKVLSSDGNACARIQLNPSQITDRFMSAMMG
ncbi:MAG: thiamine pyrophosphate-dependent enzyme [Chlamydiota bacterium]|nr:thiamine pyrophosphate-dependent enzyme [Chlamydiota bacterium]